MYYWFWGTFSVSYTQEVKPFKDVCRAALKKLVSKLKEEGFSLEDAVLIGSGATNMVTRQLHYDFFDLDYNLRINELPMEWEHNYYALRSHVKSRLDNLLQNQTKIDFKDGRDSTSALTYDAFDNISKKQIFSFDLAVFVKTKSNQYMLLKLDKASGQCILNERRDFKAQQKMASYIKKVGYANKLRELYIHEKNTNENQSSWMLYHAALHQAYQLAKKKGVK